MGKTNILNPNRYHGFAAQPPFFEGWYYKLISKDEQAKLAIIPGVYLADDPQKSHCFVQVFDSQAVQGRFHRYPLDQFNATRKSFEVSVGPNYFTKDEINLAIDDELGKISGKLNFKDLSPWPVSLVSPGAMGWFTWMPFMECYHGVVSMDHGIQGQLLLDERVLDFSGGRGYIEKDWGKQFPSAWAWGQTNHFSRAGTSLMLSVAVVPWMGRSFGGFIIGLLLDGVLHRFATYNRARIEELSIEGSSVNLVVKNRHRRLKIKAHRSGGGSLQAPTLVEMDRRIIETLDGSMAIEFETLAGETIYQGMGQHAGVEVVGDMEKLIRLIQPKALEIET